MTQVLTRINYVTRDSHPYPSHHSNVTSFARIRREYSIFNTRTPTLEHRYDASGEPQTWEQVYTAEGTQIQNECDMYVSVIFQSYHAFLLSRE